MKPVSRHGDRCLLLFALFFLVGTAASAQLPTPVTDGAAAPVVDGTISTGEYPHSSGDWYMTWDATYLYVAKANVGNAGGNVVVVYLDVDPMSTPTAGSNANGNLTAHPDESGPSSLAPNLPFRGDARSLTGSSTADLRTRDGSGTWTNLTTNSTDVMTFVSGSTHEIRIRWEATMSGATGVPASFNWLAYEIMYMPPMAAAQNTMPSANPIGPTTVMPYFFNIASVTAMSNPFGDRRANRRVSITADSGFSSLRDAVTNVNSDIDSTRRYITFDVTGPITLTSNLDQITKRVTIDGTTAPGYTSSPIVVIAGSSTQGFDFNASNCVVRGLVIQDFSDGLKFSGGSGNVVAGNWIGLNAAGTAEAGNNNGISVVGGSSLTIGGATAADRNVISGNTNGVLHNTATGTLVINNYVGTNPAGSAAIANLTGIAIESGSVTVGGTGLGNVISGNTGHGYFGVGTVVGNLIGVAADGTTPLGNGLLGVYINNGAVTIGSASAPNTIAHNGQAIRGANLGGTTYRFNSIYANAEGINIESVEPPTPTVNAASVSGGNLTLNISATGIQSPQSFQLDLYRADPTNYDIPQPKTYLAASPCYTATSLSNQAWAVGSGYATTDKLVLLITSYSDTSCTTAGAGTSEPTAVFSPVAGGAVTTTTLTSSAPVASPGQPVAFTATITSEEPNITGTVAFTIGGGTISGCGSVTISAGQAQCTMPMPSPVPETYYIVATYSGDASHAASTSATLEQVVLRTFTGIGNFTQAALWSENQLPGENEDFFINGFCTFDSSAPDLQRGAMYLGQEASMTVAAATEEGGTLRVTDVVGFGENTLTMLADSYMELSGTFDAADVTFNRGTGTVDLMGTGQTLPPLSFHNLEIHGSVSNAAGTTAVYGTLHVAGEASLNVSSGTVQMHGPQLGVSGAATFNLLTVPSGASVTSFGPLAVAGTMTVDGTFIPADDQVISGAGTLTGSGTIHVKAAGAGGTGGLATQYTMTRNLTNLTVEYSGTAAQIADATTYYGLTINNSAGVSLVLGDTRVNGILNLQSGILTGGLTVMNSSPTAVIRTSGFVSGGTLIRAYATGTNTYLFPVGRSSVYTPASLTLNSVTVAGNLFVFAANGDDPFASSTGIDTSRNANVAWSLLASTGTIGSINATFTFSTLVDGAANPLTFVLRNGSMLDPPINVPATPGATSISANGITNFNQTFFAGNQLIHHYVVSASSPQASGTTFATTVTAEDVMNITANDSSTVVTMSASSGNVQFDSNGDGTFGDNTKVLTNGTFTINTKDSIGETITITATDGNGKTGTSGSITITVSGAPPNFAATGTASQVSLTWGAVSGATSYEVFRNGSPLTSTTNTFFTDTGVTANTSYIYSVRALNGSTPSASSFDSATTYLFTDTSLSGVLMKSTHIIELRNAINSLRNAGGLSSFTFTDPSISGVAIRLVHITELRTALNEVRSLAALASVTYTDPTMTAGVTTAKAAHVTDLRGGVQ